MKFKKIVLALISIVCILCLTLTASAVSVEQIVTRNGTVTTTIVNDDDPTNGSIGYDAERDIYLIQLPPLSIRLISEETVSPLAYPEKQKSETFTYELSVGSLVLSYFDVTVTGIWSQYDNYSTITDIDVDLYGPYESWFAYTGSIQGNFATVNIVDSDYPDTVVAAAYFTLHTNGNISQNCEQLLG